MNYSELLAEVDRRASDKLISGILDLAERIDQYQEDKIVDPEVIDRILESDERHLYRVTLCPETFEIMMVNIHNEPGERNALERSHQ